MLSDESCCGWSCFARRVQQTMRPRKKWQRPRHRLSRLTRPSSFWSARYCVSPLPQYVMRQFVRDGVVATKVVTEDVVSVGVVPVVPKYYKMYLAKRLTSSYTTFVLILGFTVSYFLIFKWLKAGLIHTHFQCFLKVQTFYVCLKILHHVI